MTSLLALWLPILVSAVVVFAVSALIHMATPWHKNDYLKLDKEAAFIDAVRPLALPPGDYLVPRASSMAEMRAPEFTDKLNQGPVVVMTVLPNGPMAIGSNLACWFVYSLVIGVFAGYIASRALPPGAPYLSVFRFVGATAFMCYSLALWQLSIWYRRSLITTIKANIDGLIYALFTAGVFGWLWPA